jgi:putative hydrolase
MDDADPPSPFGGIPFFGDLSKLFAGQGDGGWEAARQLAVQLATGGVSEPNVDPALRIELEQLARVAELNLTGATGLQTGQVTVVPVTRAEWAHRSIEAYRPLFEKLTSSLGQGHPSMPDAAAGDPMAAMFSQMMSMLGPMMLSMTAGSMVGHLAGRSLGQYDIPVPRGDATEVLVVPANIEAFAEEWSLPLQDLLLWICLHELSHHAVLSVDHVHRTMDRLLLEYAGGFRSDPSGIEDRLGSIDISDPSALAELQQALGDPEVILGAIQSPEQKSMLPQLQALTAVIVGFVDHAMDRVGATLISSYGQLTEALRRRRVEADPSDRFIERMLGLELTQAQYERGSSFISGVVERAGEEGLARLWADETHLPTPNEVDAPGLWLARIDL